MKTKLLKLYQKNCKIYYDNETKLWHVFYFWSKYHKNNLHDVSDSLRGILKKAAIRFLSARQIDIIFSKKQKI